MKFRILRSEEIDREKWLALLKADDFPFPYMHPEYLDIVNPGWEALVGDDYQAGMALCKRKKFIFTYHAAPDFCQQMGMIALKKEGQAELEQTLLELAANNAQYSEFNLNHRNKGPYTIKDSSIRQRRNYELLLDKGIDELRNEYHKNHRRNLKKVDQDELKFEDNGSLDELIKLFRNNKMKELDLKGLDLGLLKRIASINDLQAEIVEVYDQTISIASALLLHFEERIVFLFSGQSEAGKTQRAMFYLIDKVLEKYAGSGKCFDFEGSDNENLAQFYRRFGAKESVYLHLRTNRLPWPFRWFKE